MAEGSLSIKNRSKLYSIVNGIPPAIYGYIELKIFQYSKSQSLSVIIELAKLSSIRHLEDKTAGKKTVFDKLIKDKLATKTIKIVFIKAHDPPLTKTKGISAANFI